MTLPKENPIGKIRIEWWGGKQDGAQGFIDESELTDRFGQYRLYSTNVNRQVDDDHRPIFALYVLDTLPEGEDLFWAPRG